MSAELCPDMPFLVPGVGAQGGDVEKVVKFGCDRTGHGIVINSSRGHHLRRIKPKTLPRERGTPRANCATS